VANLCRSSASLPDSYRSQHMYVPGNLEAVTEDSANRSIPLGPALNHITSIRDTQRAGGQIQYQHRYPPMSTSPVSMDRVRVVNSRPKPQCWEHGCDGREFSTFSNLLRHQREKAGLSAKPECPHCGTVFTRTTARNSHIAQGKCKARRQSVSQ
jgi:hypothetical protein